MLSIQYIRDNTIAFKPKLFLNHVLIKLRGIQQSNKCSFFIQQRDIIVDKQTQWDLQSDD